MKQDSQQMKNIDEIKKNKENNLVALIDKTGVEQGIEKVLKQNISLLPNNIVIDKIKASAGFYISNSKDLMLASNEAKMQTLYGVLKEAMLGCEAGTDYDILMFKGKPTFIRKKEGYFKIIDMIKPAEIIRFTNNVITSDDISSFDPVTEQLTHKFIGERYQDFEHIVGSYAYIKFANGFEKTIFLSKEDLEKIKEKSPSGQTPYSPWNSNSIKMVKTKTIKELAKELCTLWSNRLNSILVNAIESDEIAVKSIDSKGYILNDNSIYDNKENEQIEEIIEEQLNINDL